jgi:opacity protein-like surface antigen
MKKTILAVIALVATPLAAHAQNLNGFYVGARGGASWLLNSNISVNGGATVSGFGTGQLSGTHNASFNTGWALGGFAGYDFVGPRVEIETLYRDNQGSQGGILPIAGVGFLRSQGVAEVRQTSVMANVYYDFFAREVFTPYVGAGVGIAFINSHFGALTNSSDTEFAYQAIVGVGYKVMPNLRLNLDARYYGTLNPTFSNSYNPSGFTVPVSGYVSGSYPNNNFALLASVSYSFGPAPQR